MQSVESKIVISNGMLNSTECLAENINRNRKKNLATPRDVKSIQSKIGNAWHDAEPANEVDIAFDHSPAIGEQVARANLVGRRIAVSRGKAAQCRKPNLTNRCGENFQRECLQECAIGFHEVGLDQREGIGRYACLIGEVGWLVRVLVADFHHKSHVLEPGEFLETDICALPSDVPLQPGSLRKEIKVLNR